MSVIGLTVSPVKLYAEDELKIQKQAFSAHERALCQLTLCFEFQSRSERTFPVTTYLLNRDFQILLWYS